MLGGNRMLETVSQFAVGFLVGLSGTLLPGPILAFITMKSLSFGKKTGAFAAGGHIMVELGIVLLIFLGFRVLLESQLFKATVGLVGGVLLVALGSLTLAGPRGVRSPNPNPMGIEHHPFIGGVLFSSVFNPSVPLWWATIGLATLMEAVLVAGLAGAAFWLAGHFAADVSWFSLVSFSVSKSRKFVRGRAYRILVLVCGFTLLAFGSYFILHYAPAL